MPPEGLYADGSGVGVDDPLDVDAAAADSIASWFAMGDAALRTAFEDVEPVLWPEHFDLGVAVGEVNYGVSPGDSAVPRPYAYVAPWNHRSGAFWNAPLRGGANRRRTRRCRRDRRLLGGWARRGRLIRSAGLRQRAVDSSAAR